MSNRGKIRKHTIYKQIEEETDIPYNKVEEAVKHQFKQVAKLMASANRETGDFPSIRLPYWGKWKAKQKRIEYIQNKSKNKDE